MSPIIKAAETKNKKTILSKWYKCFLIDQVSIPGIPMTHNLHKALTVTGAGQYNPRTNPH